MRILCGTILASVAAVVCAAEAKGYSLADEQARATPDWFRKGVMYQIQPRAFTPEGTIEYYGVSARIVENLGIEVLEIAA